MGTFKFNCQIMLTSLMVYLLRLRNNHLDSECYLFHLNNHDSNLHSPLFKNFYYTVAVAKDSHFFENFGRYHLILRVIKV